MTIVQKNPPPRPLVAGNWKMNGTLAQAEALVRALVGSVPAGVDIVLCPPFTALQPVSLMLKGSPLRLGAQNLHWEPKGAFTGEVSGEMLAELGCEYVIIGHSERRTFFGETDDTIRKKLAAAIRANLRPIVCVGETLAEREAGKTLSVLTRQLGGALNGIDRGGLKHLTLAYEPVWAIGTGRIASPDQVAEAHHALRETLTSLCGVEVSKGVRIQYGGSVTPENAESLMSIKDVQGALVGGASLKAETFLAILAAASKR